jgi:3'-phosphoadenosine 5'-phosphosulfate sulfotransferase (PAPS reductase)/FAD synthetase
MSKPARLRWESSLSATERVLDWLDDPRIVFVVNISGGKDSTATALWFREIGLPHVRVFADTGWEAPETYAYVDLLRARLGPIDVVGVAGGMVAKIRARAGFPSRRQRWCTRELKVEPLRAYHDKIEATGREAVCVTGIRVEESNGKGDGSDRGTWPMLEFDDDWDGWMYRPLLHWTIEDVLAIHHRHGVPVNPLYQRGHDRVGCYPCIMSNKTDIRLVACVSPRSGTTRRP